MEASLSFASAVRAAAAGCCWLQAGADGADGGRRPSPSFFVSEVAAGVAGAHTGGEDNVPGSHTDRCD